MRETRNLNIEYRIAACALGLILVSGFCIPVSTKVAKAAVEYGDQSFSFSSGTAQSVKDITSDISLKQVSGTVGFFGRMWEATKNGFNAADQWLAEKAGINLVGILRTLGSWFIVVLEWMLVALKWVFAQF